MWISRRVLMIAGAASLLLNVFLIGIIAGRVAGARKPPAGVPASGQLVRPNALSPDDRRIFAAGMAPHRPGLKAARTAHRAARVAIEADLTAPTYDRAKVTEDFAALVRLYLERAGFVGVEAYALGEGGASDPLTVLVGRPRS